MKLSVLDRQYKEVKQEYREVFKDVLKMNIDKARQHYLKRCDERGFDIKEMTERAFIGIRKNIRAIRWELKNDTCVDVLLKINKAIVVAKINKNGVPRPGDELGETPLVTLITVYKDDEQIPRKETGRITFIG